MHSIFALAGTVQLNMQLAKGVSLTGNHMFPLLQGYGNRKFVFQGVHETICYGPSDRPWTEDEPRINQIVFIGKDLDRKALMNGFR
jgi:G3E family GTPase